MSSTATGSWWTSSRPAERRGRPTRTIDLNADVGRGDAIAAGIEVERALLGLVTTVHVACGGHAGDEDSMAATVAAALEHAVRVGAHPSYPDRDGFGRQPDGDRPRRAAATSLTEQLRALGRVCRTAGTAIASVKAHGALYEEVAQGRCRLRDLARRRARHLSARARRWCSRRAVAPWRWCCATACAACEEGFCDRAYRPDGGLVDRATPGAVLAEPEEAARAGAQPGPRRGGRRRRVRADPVGRHAVHPRRLARGGRPSPTAVRRALADAGIDVVAPARA